MALKVGEEYELELDPRYFRQNRSHAMGDVFDALVELVTNVDDSYGRMFRRGERKDNGGPILIEYQERRKGEASCIVVRDEAEGLDLKEIDKKLRRVGGHSSERGDRGFAGRGAKDCTELGDLIYESIKNERYYRCVLTHEGKVRPEADGARVTDELRRRLGIRRGNGTSATLKVDVAQRFVRFETLMQRLPDHFALRDIMAVSSSSHVKLRKLDSGDKAIPLVYRPPIGDIVVDTTFDIEDYPGACANLRIWRAVETLAAHEGGARFERFGILIKDDRAIHECSLLADEFKKEANAHRYFGRIDCPYMTDLMEEYDARSSVDEPHPDSNPSLLIDPNRRQGLNRAHPFVQKLLVVPSEHLRALLAAEKKEEASQERKVANQETERRLGQLAKLADKFLREQLDDLEDIGAGEDIDDTAFAKQGILIYPTYPNVGVGRERALTIYVRRSLLSREDTCVQITTDAPGTLEILQSSVSLHAHKTKTDRALGLFHIKGLQPGQVIIQASCDGLPIAEALAQVVTESAEDRSFAHPVEFERADYSVRVSSQKSLLLYAKYPDVVAQETYAELSSSDPNGVVIKGRCLMSPVAGCNYAEGSIVVHGRTLQCKATITAKVNGRKAEAQVRVVDRPEKDAGTPLSIKLTETDLGVYRASFERESNTLLVSARHKSLSRYLGAEADSFPGQDAPHFRVLLAEIVAEAIARRALIIEVERRPWDFDFRNESEPGSIAVDVLSHLHRRLRDFAAQAHSIMLGDQELKSLACMR